MQQIELLAPAGSFEALKAAVQNGADAVYLGGMNFGARAYASNFNEAEIKEAVEYAHIRGVKVYVTVNILVKDSEIEELMEYIKFLYEIKVDAVIVQDMGVFNLIKSIFPDLEIHASTQMTLHSKHGVQLLKSMGVHRAVLARELTIEEIKSIYDDTHMELEVFVHGALCVCYSGQCLMSSFIGGRSGNRGRCAQPCRKEYEFVNLNKNAYGEPHKAYHLSMRDLNTVEYIGRLIDAGVTSFKIEGRMKKPQYVASIVRGYRKAIDTYLNSRQSLKDRALEQEMEQMFNRKFTKGYLFGTPKAEVINIEKPNNRGLYLGQVETYKPGENKLKIKLKADIAQGDGIEVWKRSLQDIGGIVRNIYKNNKLVKEAKAGDTVEIEIRGNIQKGDQVYKTLNASLNEELEKTYIEGKEYRKVPVYGQVKVNIGEKIKFYLWDEKGNTAYIESEDLVQEAEKVPLTENKLYEQLSKLGNTPFELQSLDVDLEKNSAISLSILNKVRRDAVDQIMELRKTQYRRKEVSNSAIRKQLRDTFLSSDDENPRTVKDPNISVKVDTLDQLTAVISFPVKRVYYSNLDTLKEAVQLCREKNIEIYFRTPSILRDKEYERVGEVISDLSIDGILGGDLGIIHYNREHLKLPMVTDASLNIINSYSIQTFKDLGVNGVTLSPELDLKTIGKLRLHNSLDKEVLIYGNITVMVTEYCPLVQENYCNHQCQDCSFPKYQYSFGLKDSKNMTFPFGKDCWGRSMVLNSQPLFMLDKLSDFRDMNIQWFRLEFTNDSIQEIRVLLNAALNNMKVLKNPKDQGLKESTVDIKGGYTRGHYYRGIE